MTLLSTIDTIRLKASEGLDHKRKSSLGQFFTPSGIAGFMASLFESIEGEVRLLDPGCGIGSLTAAFLAEAVHRQKLSRLEAIAYELDAGLLPELTDSLEACQLVAQERALSFDYQVVNEDFLIKSSIDLRLPGFDLRTQGFTHVIMNPPYKKISTKSEHRLALHEVGLETVNLYTGFIAMAIKWMKPGGELVAIVPRSFCNGPYYQPFREFLLREMDLRHLHIFDKRNQAFEDVLQENVILHGIKAPHQGEVTITASPSAQFQRDAATGRCLTPEMTRRQVPFESVVQPEDPHAFIHIVANEAEQAVIDRLSCFTATLGDLGLQVSTGPVVDFRLKEDLRDDLEAGAVPLLYPLHLNGGIHWPKVNKKANAIRVSPQSRSWLWANQGHFVLTRRFSAKEEKRRIYASLYDASLPGELIGFDNKLNVFHARKKGLPADVAKGLYVYLNSSLLDRYYRQFGGHTQVNATDLRNINYPGLESLQHLGKQVQGLHLDQQKIDQLIDQEIERRTQP